jgi:hypothetical protein
VKARFTWVAVVLTAAFAGAAPARAEVRVVVVPSLDLPAVVAQGGAIGLLVPAWGDTVSRRSALQALVSGRLSNPHRPRPGPAVIDVAEAASASAGDGGEPIVIEVVLPGPGSRQNDRRYPIAILGGGYHGLLRSPSTRITGLVSIGDVAPTALALAGRPIPDTVTGHALSYRASSDPVGALAHLDTRLRDARHSRDPATIAYGLLLVALAALAVVLRSAGLGRAALFALPAAATASLALSIAGVSGWAPFIAATGGLALGAAVFLRGQTAIGLALAAVLLFHGVATSVDGEAMSLSIVGPNPDAGGRFYGFSNELETILVGTGIVAGALVWKQLGTSALMIVGALAIVVMTPARAGASVTGAIVIAVGYAVLALDLEGLRGLLPLAVVGGAAAAALLLAAPPHVAGAGPGRLVDRIELSARLSVDSVQSILLTYIVGLGVLVAIAWRYPRLRSELDTVDATILFALLVAVVVSVVINDAPTAVLPHGAAWCLAVAAYGLSRSEGRRPSASYTLAPVCVGLPSSRLRSRRSR